MADTFGTFTKNGKTRTADTQEQAVRFRYAGWRPVDAKAAEDPATVPPRGGAGSGRDTWADYATANGVEVDAEMTRDDIIAALDAAGVATGDEQ